jgi:hypothetical protein
VFDGPTPDRNRLSAPRRVVLTAHPKADPNWSVIQATEHQQGMNIPDLALDAHPEGMRASCSLERR